LSLQALLAQQLGAVGLRAGLRTRWHRRPDEIAGSGLEQALVKLVIA